MHRSPLSMSSPQSPMDPTDRGREREHPEHRRAPQESSRSPPVSSTRIAQGHPTSLPSIRNLHLPPPHAHRHAAPAQQHSPSEFLPSASYGSSSFFAGTHRSPALASAYPSSTYTERRLSIDRPPTSSWTQAPPSTYAEQHVSAPEGDSDQEQNEAERGPPKKKRRRQALSCTECKRRKIKCDRAHPCGPCTRRSEPDKCQWHVIEPVDKYVTRSEWDELFQRYRVLEERCIRLEKLVVQLHPELTEGSPYETSTAHPATMTGPRPISTRIHPFAGSAISGTSANSRTGNQHVTPSTPLSALPGPGPSPRHGPGSGVPSLPIGSTTGAGSGASTRSGSAPPPAGGTTQTVVPHPPTHPDRRTSTRASFHSASERPVFHQVSETGRGRPFTSPSPRSYTLRPPPPPPENPPTHLPPRTHSSYLQGRSSTVSELPSIPSPRLYATRAPGRPYPSPLSAVSGSRHMHSDRPSPESAREDMEERYASRYIHDTGHERNRDAVYERSEQALRRRHSDSKNEEAQTLEADDVLRQRKRRSASSACSNNKRSFSSCQRTADDHSDPSVSPILHPKSEHAYSDGSMPPSPRFHSPEVYASSYKRARIDSLHLNIPSCGSAPEMSPPAVAVH